MKRYADLLAEARTRIREVLPWHLRDRLAQPPPPLVIDVREAAEFAQAHIEGSINVPRGVLEAACEWGHEETVALLAASRARPIVLVCRSGNRSALAADVMQVLGFTDVVSLRTGVRGWNDFDQPLVAAATGPLDPDDVERLLAPPLRPDQRRPD